MNTAIDFRGINAAASRNAHSLLPEVLPGGKFHGEEYVVKNPRRYDQRLGSFSINYRTGIWKDFATNDGGGDFVSLVAYIIGCSQGDAARELADRLRVPLIKTGYKSNGYNEAHNSSPISRPATSADVDVAGPKPKVFVGGNGGPPPQSGEMRRHLYSTSGVAMRVKIKFADGKFANWYRVFVDGAPLGWQPKKPDSYRPIPYVTAAIDPFDPELISDEILWPEGEKDVDSLSAINLPAFTFGGVGDGLPDGIAENLKDRRIVILADNDEPGRIHAEKKAAVAHAAGATSIRIVHFPDLPPKGDVSDFLANRGTAEQLQAGIDATSLWSPLQTEFVEKSKPAGRKTSELLLLSGIKPEATDWLWHNQIPRGAQTISTGWPGVGKSQQQCDIVARVSTGTAWPDGSLCPCGDTIMLTCEDSYAKTVVPRLLAAGANLERVYALPIIRINNGAKRAFLLTEDLDELERHLTALPNALLVTIDPITGFLGAGKVDSNSVTDIRGTLAPLSALAEQYNIGVHTVTHPPKNTVNAMNAFIGSQAFVAVSRMAYLTTEEMDEEGKHTGRYLMAMVRSSLGPKLPTLAYRLAQVTVGQDHRDQSSVPM
jgi:AAA domain